MEQIGMNNLNSGSRNEQPQIIPGSEGWLGGEELKDKMEEEFSREMLGQLSEGEALDGGEKFEVPIPRDHLFGKEEVIEEAEAIPDHLEKAKDLVLITFVDYIAQGAREGWDTVSNKPDARFIELRGTEIEKIVEERAKGWKENCVVYDLLRSEPMPSLNDREKITKDHLLKRASRRCSS